MKKKLHVDLDSVLKRYNAILKPCPKCGKTMTPLGDSSIESYLYCFDCKIQCDFEGKERRLKSAKLSGCCVRKQTCLK